MASFVSYSFAFSSLYCRTSFFHGSDLKFQNQRLCFSSESKWVYLVFTATILCFDRWERTQVSAGEELAVPFIHDPPATKPPPGLQTSHAPESSFSAPRLQPLHPQQFACRPLLRETLFLGFSVPLSSESPLISLILILCLFRRFQILF